MQFNAIILLSLRKPALKLIPSAFYSKKYIQKKSVRLERKLLLKDMDDTLFKPPLRVKGMTELNKDLFSKVVKIPTLTIPSNKKPSYGVFCNYLKKYLLKMPNFKPLVESEGKLQIFLDPRIVTSFFSISFLVICELHALGVGEKSFNYSDIEVGFDNYSAKEIIKSVLPEGESVTSFTQIGHIIHLNLNDSLLKYKHIIGQVLLDKNKTCKTVVNKLNNIENKYRNFQMEILCGEDNTIVQVRENFILYTFDFAKVYWNSRLSTEHERIIGKLSPGDILYDVFAGIGPFSLPCVKKKCYVFANDLNPESFKWLEHNIKSNKLNESYIKIFNKDGRDFIRTDLRTDLSERLLKIKDENIHITMNLPALAVEFLNEFRGLLKLNESDWDKITKYPIVHVYCFTKGLNPKQLALNAVETHLGCKLEDNLIEIFDVRNVSSFKEMMRVSFILTKDILMDRKRTVSENRGDGEEQGQKQDEKRFHGSGCEESKAQKQSETG